MTESRSSAGLPAVARALQRMIVLSASFVALVLGYLIYLISGRTPRLSFHSMRRLYGPTEGALNRFFLRQARRFRPAPPIASVDGFLGTFSPAEMASLVARIESDGFAMFDRRVPADICDALTEFARTTPCLAMGQKLPVIYTEESASALRYDFSEQLILDNPAACRMVFDGTLATIAAAYFKCQPIYDFCAMWWTTRHGERDYSQAAQKFHFDMDRPFFLKFFVYLTDVTPPTGPHVFVTGSHKDKPPSLRDARRFEDAEVEACYPADDINVICGPKGSIFAVDTMGLHKGLPVISGHRLAFQIEFTISRFGQNYPKATVRTTTLRDAGVPLPVDARTFAYVVET